MEDYFYGLTTPVSKEEEKLIMKDCKNTGKMAENYICNILTELKIKYKKNMRIPVGNSYIIPDFYIPHLDLIFEVKSRGYNSPGTASEKIDNIPRKYSQIIESVGYSNTKVVVVFCAYEAINKKNLELVNPVSNYCKDFVNLCKKYNVIDFICVKDIYKYLDVTTSLVINPKPVIKWVGGKSKLKSVILQAFPKEYNNYFEPFIGGGAIGLSIKDTRLKYFSDINHNLINFYITVKNDCELLIEELNTQGKYINNKECFSLCRDVFNYNKDISTIEKSALFIYLNKCCFNGLYRENNSGIYNVPFGDMKNPTICDANQLKTLSNYLQNVDLKCCEYYNVNPKSGDFVYLDPPYHNTFTKYTKNVFEEQQQLELRNFCDKLNESGVKFLASNNDTEFINEIYKKYKITKVDTKYSVGGSRGKKQEVLISNY
jgi:DNA adenine methylase